MLRKKQNVPCSEIFQLCLQLNGTLPRRTLQNERCIIWSFHLPAYERHQSTESQASLDITSPPRKNSRAYAGLAEVAGRGAELIRKRLEFNLFSTKTFVDLCLRLGRCMRCHNLHYYVQIRGRIRAQLHAMSQWLRSNLSHCLPFVVRLRETDIKQTNIRL